MNRFIFNLNTKSFNILCVNSMGLEVYYQMSIEIEILYLFPNVKVIFVRMVLFACIFFVTIFLQIPKCY